MSTSQLVPFAAAGSGVCNFKAGDRVFSPFTTNCGACFYCRRQLTARCVGQKQLPALHRLPQCMRLPCHISSKGFHPSPPALSPCLQVRAIAAVWLSAGGQGLARRSGAVHQVCALLWAHFGCLHPLVSCHVVRQPLPATDAPALTWGSGTATAGVCRVPLADATLAHAPPELSDEEALLLGDIFSTGFFCADNASLPSLAAAARGSGDSSSSGGSTGSSRGDGSSRSSLPQAGTGEGAGAVPAGAAWWWR